MSYSLEPRARVEGEEIIEAGCTPGWVELSRTPSGVYILAMLADENPENRWISGMNTSMMKAFEAVEAHLEDAGDTPAALLTISDNPKFFSNGIDPDGNYTKDHAIPAPTKDEAVESGMVGMSAFFRPLQLPIPTIAAINGHAFGAGMMFAVAHDYRLQREDRGYMCAVEIEIGAGFPTPEKFLFQHVLSKPNAQRAMLGAKRWSAQDSLKADLIEEACSESELFSKSLAFAEQEARLASSPHRRELYYSVKNQMKGHVMKACMDYTFPEGVFPPTIEEKFPAVAASVKQNYPQWLKHVGEVFSELPGGEFMEGAGRSGAQDTYDLLYDNRSGDRVGEAMIKASKL